MFIQLNAPGFARRRQEVSLPRQANRTSAQWFAQRAWGRAVGAQWRHYTPGQTAGNVSENTSMTPLQGSWDYLVVTASSDVQAEAYRSQIELRRSIGQLTQVRQVLVVPDLEGRRIGSGGSTIECLRQVVERERTASPAEGADTILRRL